MKVLLGVSLLVNIVVYLVFRSDVNAFMSVITALIMVVDALHEVREAVKR